jgi:hypothetical protein
VAHFNTTGKSYIGSYDPQLHARIVELYKQLRCDIPSGLLYAQNLIDFGRTGETIGITPLCNSVKKGLGIPDGSITSTLGYGVPSTSHPIIHSAKVPSMLEWLAQRQNVQYAVIPITTVEEMALFKTIIRENPKAPSDWIGMCRLWNPHVDGIAVFYKLPSHFDQYFKFYSRARNDRSTIANGTPLTGLVKLKIKASKSTGRVYRQDEDKEEIIPLPDPKPPTCVERLNIPLTPSISVQSRNRKFSMANFSSGINTKRKCSRCSRVGCQSNKKTCINKEN